MAWSALSLFYVPKLAFRQENGCVTVSYFFPQGRFTIAAKHHITIAEIYETELVDIEKVSSGHTSSDVKQADKLTQRTLLSSV